MQIEVKGRNLQVTDELREYVERRFDKIGKQVSELAVLELEVADENVPGDPVARRGGPAPQGHARCAPRRSPRTPSTRSTWSRDNMERQVKRHRDKRRGRRESRAAAEVRAQRDGAASRRAPGSLVERPPSRARSTARLGSYVHPRARPPNGRSEAVQGLRQARRADQRLGAGARAARGRGAARAVRRAARARAGRARTSTSCCPRRSRSRARSAAARWRCATSTCS